MLSAAQHLQKWKEGKMKEVRKCIIQRALNENDSIYFARKLPRETRRASCSLNALEAFSGVEIPIMFCNCFGYRRKKICDEEKETRWLRRRRRRNLSSLRH
jgi:hypothetical protein